MTTTFLMIGIFVMGGIFGAFLTALVSVGRDDRE